MLHRLWKALKTQSQSNMIIELFDDLEKFSVSMAAENIENEILGPIASPQIRSLWGRNQTENGKNIWVGRKIIVHNFEKIKICNWNKNFIKSNPNLGI
jgi:ribosomal protein L13